MAKASELGEPSLWYSPSSLPAWPACKVKFLKASDQKRLLACMAGDAGQQHARGYTELQAMAAPDHVSLSLMVGSSPPIARMLRSELNATAKGLRSKL